MRRAHKCTLQLNCTRIYLRMRLFLAECLAVFADFALARAGLRVDFFLDVADLAEAFLGKGLATAFAA